jgi:hypothetical protein
MRSGIEIMLNSAVLAWMAWEQAEVDQIGLFRLRLSQIWRPWRTEALPQNPSGAVTLLNLLARAMRAGFRSGLGRSAILTASPTAACGAEVTGRSEPFPDGVKVNTRRRASHVVVVVSVSRGQATSAKQRGQLILTQPRSALIGL